MNATNGGQGSTDGNDLWYYLAVLRRRWWLIASTALIAFGMAWWAERGSLPRYTAEALLEQREPQDATGPAGSHSCAHSGQTYICPSW